MSNIIDIEKLSSDVQAKVLEDDDTTAIQTFQNIVDRSGMRGFFGKTPPRPPTGIVLDYDVDEVKGVLRGESDHQRGGSS